MSAEYKPVEIEINEDEQTYEDVHLMVNGVKLDLPNLNSTDLPIELVQMILIVKSTPVLSDEDTARAMSVFLAYFQAVKPNFWSALRKTNNAMAYLVATIKAWAEQSGIDPKAFTSPSSTRTTMKH
jgi:hypothetical protein